MKRHPALQPLSRDHHHALAVARRLRRATDETAGETVGVFLAHWHTEEKQHFRLEEEVLLPAFAVHGDPHHPAVVRMLIDHMLIRRDVDRLTGSSPLELLHDLGARLSSHVELEEREVFPLVEATIPERELVQLEAQLTTGAG
jgi:hemerythrin-like domain-containing protein